MSWRSSCLRMTLQTSPQSSASSPIQMPKVPPKNSSKGRVPAMEGAGPAGVKVGCPLASPLSWRPQTKQLMDAKCCYSWSWR